MSLWMGKKDGDYKAGWGKVWLVGFCWSRLLGAMLDEKKGKFISVYPDLPVPHIFGTNLPVAQYCRVTIDPCF